MTESVLSANKALVRQWFEEVWNQQREEMIDKLRAPDSIAVGLGHGNAEVPTDVFKNFYYNVLEAFPDLHGEIDDIIAEGDKVAARLTFTATHLGHSLGVPPTTRKVRFGCLVMARVVNGKIADAWNSVDHLGILHQVGAVEPTAFGPEFFTGRIVPKR